MEVLLLTTLFSVLFAVLFLALFLRERQTRRFGGVEREALMPLDDEDGVADGAGERADAAEEKAAGTSRGSCGSPGRKKSCQGCPCGS